MAPLCYLCHILSYPVECLPGTQNHPIPLFWWGSIYWEKSKLKLPLLFVLYWQAMVFWVCSCQKTSLDILPCLLLFKWYNNGPHCKSQQCSSSFSYFGRTLPYFLSFYIMKRQIQFFSSSILCFQFTRKFLLLCLSLNSRKSGRRVGEESDSVSQCGLLSISAISPGLWKEDSRSTVSLGKETWQQFLIPPIISVKF